MTLSYRAHDSSSAKAWFALAGFILAVKLGFLTIDPYPRFFLGDSAAYLASALGIWVPNDRSFTYGRDFIHPILDLFHSISAVVVVQSMLGAVNSLLAALCLHIGFRAPFWVAAATAILYSFEPLGLSYERFIMTETLTLFFFAMFVLTGLIYIVKPRMWLLVVLALMGTCVLSLRTFHIPVVIISTVAAVLLASPGLRQLTAEGRRTFPRFAAHALVALAATVVLHLSYQSYFALLTKQSPSYNGLDGLFLAAAWAPLVTRDDFPDKKVADRVLSELTIDLKDRWMRPAHRYWQGGLAQTLARERGGEIEANAIAKEIALNAAKRDSLGVMRLSLQTYADYWNRNIIRDSIAYDLGQKQLDRSLIDHFKKCCAEDLSKNDEQKSFTRWWHQAATPWYNFFLLSPILSVLLCIPRRYRAEAAFLGVTSLAVLMVSITFGTGAVVRYHPTLGWLTAVQLGVLLCYVCNQHGLEAKGSNGP